MDSGQNFKCWYRDVCSQLSHNCACSCLRFSEMLYLVQQSGIPQSKWYPITLDSGSDYDKFVRLAEIKDDISDFVKNGSNLYITSANTGNGKTSWSLKLMLKYFDTVWAGNGFRTRGLFLHVPTLLLQLKNFNEPLSEEYKQNILNCDLVIWDEIGYSGLSNYDYTNLLMFLENRILNGRANIFTSNCNTKKKLEEVVGSKLASRVWETSEIIEFKGKDQR